MTAAVSNDADAGMHYRSVRRRYPMADPERYDYDDRRYRDPEGGSGLVGYAAIKYAAIVIIVLAIRSSPGT
ncbi:MAG: hypothetical protein ACXVQ0_06685 [Actinomycetota bacterium]